MAPLKPKSRMFDVSAALKSGYTQAEIDDFLRTAGKGLTPVYTEPSKTEKLSKDFQKEVNKSGVKITPPKKIPVVEKKGRIVNDLSQIDRENMDMAGMPDKIGMEDIVKMILEFYGNPNQTNLIEPIKRALDAKAKQSAMNTENMVAMEGGLPMKNARDLSIEEIDQLLKESRSRNNAYEFITPEERRRRQIEAFSKKTSDFDMDAITEHPDDRLKNHDRFMKKNLDIWREDNNSQMTDHQILNQYTVQELLKSGYPVQNIPENIKKLLNPSHIEGLRDGYMKWQDIRPNTPEEVRDFDVRQIEGKKMKNMNRARRMEGQKMWDDNFENIASAPVRTSYPNLEYWKNKPLPKIDHYGNMRKLVEASGFNQTFIPSHVDLKKDSEGLMNAIRQNSLPPPPVTKIV